MTAGDLIYLAGGFAAVMALAVRTVTSSTARNVGGFVVADLIYLLGARLAADLRR